MVQSGFYFVCVLVFVLLFRVYSVLLRTALFHLSSPHYTRDGPFRGLFRCYLFNFFSVPLRFFSLLGLCVSAYYFRLFLFFFFVFPTSPTPLDFSVQRVPVLFTLGVCMYRVDNEHCWAPPVHVSLEARQLINQSKLLQLACTRDYCSNEGHRNHS